MVQYHPNGLTWSSTAFQTRGFESGCMQAFNESSTEFLSMLSEDEVTKAIELLKKLQKAFKNK